MNGPPTDDLDVLQARFEDAAEVLLADGDTPASTPEPAGDSPRERVAALARVLDILRRYPMDRTAGSMSGDDLTRVGDYGLHLLMDLAAQAGECGLPDTSREFEDLSLPLALYVARHGGRLRSLEPVVNALAQLANALRDPRQLEQLFERCSRVVLAVAPDIRQDLERTNPQRPWRVLLINRAIVATRSFLPGLMNQAFEDLVQHLPEDAPRFFAEGMQQMDALNYPARVREVVERYHREWQARRTLH